MELVCDYCNKKLEKSGFWIGSCGSFDPDWTMMEGSGKMSCPDCLPKAKAEAKTLYECLIGGRK